jgi:N-acetylneuraminic acid mutarotase
VIVSGCCNEWDLYTLNLDNKVTEEWVTHRGVYGPIWNISSYKKACYVTAGKQDRKLYQFTWRAESNTSSWRYMSDLPEILKEGGCFCPVASENHIYMFGGLLKGKPFKTAFVYDIKGDKWMPLPDMPFRSYNCSAVLYDKTLYLAGGRSVDNKGIHDVIAISPHEPSWRSHSVLEYGNATLSAIQDNLIATGGVSCAEGDVKNAYVFDFKSNQWLPLPDMLTPRSKYGACVMNSNSLAVIGGQLNTTCEILTIH